MTEKWQQSCFCGCGKSAEMGRWFVRGHEVTAAAALRTVEELRLAHELISLGFGPERSVVQMAAVLTGRVPCPRCAYVGTSTAHTCPADAPAADRPPAEPGLGLEQAQEPVPPGPAVASLAKSGAAQGRLLPGADDPTWTAVPLHLRQQLRGPAQELVSPARGPLAAPENRRLLSAVRAASRMQMTGAHWTLLLTTSREAIGSPRSQRAQMLYAALEQVAAQHAVPAEDEGAGPRVRPAVFAYSASQR
ncbi:hypothetical protein [Streptomyces niveus]|uniref:hypothetical protein n=1 Tax=Streptomyces niveus TaxID=193462 RepID=UPI003413E84D